MIRWWALVLPLLVTAAPTQLRVFTARGQTVIALWNAPGDGPMVPLLPLAQALGGTVKAEAGGGTLTVAGGSFRFRVGMTLVSEGARVRSLPAAVRTRHDSLFVPLAFIADVLADPARKAWRWSAPLGALADSSRGAATAAGMTTALPVGPGVARPATSSPRPAPGTTAVEPPVVTPLPAEARAAAASTGAAPMRRHKITIDPGHGGIDSGNRGVAFPVGTWEKDVTLQVGLKLRDELRRRGVDVTMTRTTDTLINLNHRAPRYCRRDCDLFVSLHVNSLDKAPGYTNTRGFETFFMALQARGVDAARVAKMENEAVRFELPDPEEKVGTGLDFILKDQQSNLFFRESGALAATMQQALRGVHTGPDRGVKQANFAVLRTALSPAVLVELGFSTNAADVKMMTTREGQAKLVDGIADAIMAFLQDYDRRNQPVEPQP